MKFKLIHYPKSRKLDGRAGEDTFKRMAAATLTRARSLVFRLAPEDQVELASAIVSRVSQLPASRPRKRSAVSVVRKVNHLAKAIGSPLTGKELDARLEKAMSGKEKGVPASVAIKETRKRLGL
ncbi:MAG: hypothetical protein LV480_12110 [Methylacidiphilales bacterium]|nr:hypothetical protein [Candidatus Methylacidiphilales bacterium]